LRPYTYTSGGLHQKLFRANRKLTPRDADMTDSPLPPSMEKAYHQKCIELKRRLREVEEANEAALVRKQRLDRAITKMRITRAFLLEQVAKTQANVDGEDDKSESPPPTVSTSLPTDVSSPSTGETHTPPPGRAAFTFSVPPKPQSSAQDPPPPVHRWHPMQVGYPPFVPIPSHLPQIILTPPPIDPLTLPLAMRSSIYPTNNESQPQERPARTRRGRRTPPIPSDAHSRSMPSEPPMPPMPAREIFAQPPVASNVIIAPQPVFHGPPPTHRLSLSHPIAGPPPHAHAHALASAHVQPHAAPVQVLASHNHAAPMLIPTNRAPLPYGRPQPENLPQIHSLPNGTSVMLIGPAEPKPAPWTIRDLGPQHQINENFDLWDPATQERYIFDAEMPYLPYNIFGQAVRLDWIESLGRYKHVAPGDADYKNPVQGNIRIDTPDRRRRHFHELMLAQQKQQQQDMASSQRRASERDNHRRRESREVNVPAPLSSASDVRGSERPVLSPRRERVTERVTERVIEGPRRESGRASDRNREAMREAREREMAEDAEAHGSPVAAKTNGTEGTPIASGTGGFTAVNR
jgi:hypothetical protein